MKRREHQFLAQHSSGTGTILRRCLHCGTKRELGRDGRVVFVSRDGARTEREPACVPQVPSGVAGRA